MTDSLTNKLVRDDVRDMVAYQSARRGQSGGTCWLNANEAGGNNQLQINLSNLNRYPDFQPTELVNNYAQYANLPAEQVLATRGADEGIEVLIRTFCASAKDNIVICPPTYGMYAISAKGHNSQTTLVPLTDDLQLDIPALERQVGQCKIVFICSPNNPTGDIINRDDIIRVIELFKDSALVVVDEAYIEFCPECSFAELINTYPNLVVLRTLSKAFALAGLRCGFTLASKDIIAMMSKIIAPYPISQPVAAIASSALTTEGLAIMTNRVQQTLGLRKQLEQFLDKQNWLNKRFQSNTNYVLFNTDLAPQLFSFLTEQGVLIRNQSSQLTLENCLRVSIGSKQEMQQFIDATNAFNQTLNNNQQSN
ncbi:histidinol-phosphate transaminase [Thalassomonas sp. M1454]|uniref:histidinol-phosphate transaminase n=1 Tax=Thalassomonas sp. M1454 TaxID=2594477 RepID=UPI00117E9425|nr:histidinol-phosphate transaminase [Thalassomonas sp. M1454]TRX57133.1 histidinol-phosphate transaminase [Thalassomonas sp. M1454]